VETLATEPVIVQGGCPCLPRQRSQTEEAQRQRVRPHRWGALFAAAVLAAGMALVPLHSTGISLTKLPGDEIDSHFNLYVLEHGWLWLTGKQPRFWDAPFFHPQPNVIAYSDSHLGTLPLYAVFRFVGFDRETAFQWWFLTLFVLNYLACSWVLWRWQGNWAGAAAGAYLFTFGVPVVMQIGHVQLIPRFLVPWRLTSAFVCAATDDRATCWDWELAWLGSVIPPFMSVIFSCCFWPSSCRSMLCCTGGRSWSPPSVASAGKPSCLPCY
jgi:hypothetical protein